LRRPPYPEEAGGGAELAWSVHAPVKSYAASTRPAGAEPGRVVAIPARHSRRNPYDAMEG